MINAIKNKPIYVRGFEASELFATVPKIAAKNSIVSVIQAIEYL